LEFFEALIGCGIKLYQNKLPIKREIPSKNSKKRGKMNEQPPEIVIHSPDKILTSERAPTQNTNKETATTTITATIFDQTQTQTQLNETSIQTPKTETTTAVNDQLNETNNLDETQETTTNTNQSSKKTNINNTSVNTERDLQLWTQTNNSFFNKTLFPAFQNYQTITQLANRLL
jgi:hypothetical protein